MVPNGAGSVNVRLSRLDKPRMALTGGAFFDEAREGVIFLRQKSL
jgi:hypothetical protein